MMYYEERVGGPPRKMTCSCCGGGKRVPVGRLILCPKCDSQEIIAMRAAGKDTS